MKLKLTKSIYIGYTGLIGRYQFVDGVSVEDIPAVERTRIAANIQCVEVDDDGVEGNDPSPAANVIAHQRTRALLSALPRQTEEEKVAENVRAVMGSEEQKTLYSRYALDAVASKSGIAGLREIAGDWNVKSKSIPVLIQMIIDAQGEYISKQRDSLTKKGVSVEEINRLLVLVDEVNLTKTDAKPVAAKVAQKPEAVIVQAVVTAAQAQETAAADALSTAAMTGDLAAALNATDAVAPADEADSAEAIKADTKQAFIEIVEADRPE